MAKTRQKILITHDRSDAIAALKELLSQYDITTAADTQEAARLAAQEDFALVITDYVVPSVWRHRGNRRQKNLRGREREG